MKKKNIDFTALSINIVRSLLEFAILFKAPAISLSINIVRSRYAVGRLVSYLLGS